MAATASRGRSGSAGLGEVLRIRVELWLAVVFMALAFGAGMAVRVTTEPPAAAPVSTTIGAGTSQVAPPLTDAQIAAGLPAGHPDLASNGGSSGKNGDKAGTKSGAKSGAKSGQDTNGNGGGASGTP
ncbi:MAG: hypothetical protein ACXVP7_05530 [Actinomycetota bacterium]